MFGKSKKGVSFLELLVAIVISAIILILTAPVFRAYYQTYSIARARFELSRDANMMYSVLRTRIRLAHEWRVAAVNTYDFYEVTNFSTFPQKSDFLNSANITIRRLKYDSLAKKVIWYKDISNLSESMLLANNVDSFSVYDPWSLGNPDGANATKNRVHIKAELSKPVSLKQGSDLETEYAFDAEFSLRARNAKPDIDLSP